MPIPVIIISQILVVEIVTDGQLIYDNVYGANHHHFCAVDPMPKWLVKDWLDDMISLITNIVKKLLSLGVFPRSMKAALVKPLI